MIPLKDDNPTSNRPIVTYFLIGICVVVFFMELNYGCLENKSCVATYGLIPAVLMGNLPTTTDGISIPVLPFFVPIFTSMFMHGSFIHLAGNMLYMWIFADNIEDNLGPTKFIIFYLLSGIGAAMSHVLVDTGSLSPMIGASGAIGGVLGAYLINHPNARVLVLIPYFIITIIKIRAFYVLGFWFILQFYYSYISSGDGGVAYAAHIGGFISGMILILFFNKKRKKKFKIMKGPWGQ